MAKNDYCSEAIRLPLAPDSSREIRQKFFKEITDSPYIATFFHSFSEYSSRHYYYYCFVCGRNVDVCDCRSPENYMYPSKNYELTNMIKLPLAVNSTEEVQQSIYSAIKYNPDILEFLKKYSPLYTVWYGDQCYICGQFPNGCNCDGYYNIKEDE